MAKTLITDIGETIKAGGTKTEVKAVIQQYLIDWEYVDGAADPAVIQQAVIDWILANKDQLLIWALPSHIDFLIFWAKATSGEEPYATEGAAQLASYRLLIMNLIKKFETFET